MFGNSKRFVVGADGGLYDQATGQQVLTPEEAKRLGYVTLGVGALVAFGLGALTTSIFGD